MEIEHDARIGGREPDTLQATSFDGLGNWDRVAPLHVLELDCDSNGQDPLCGQLLLMKQRRPLKQKNYALPRSGSSGSGSSGNGSGSARTSLRDESPWQPAASNSRPNRQVLDVCVLARMQACVRDTSLIVNEALLVDRPQPIA
jgi:hypothetical protein